jgi:hypothetical protein
MTFIIFLLLITVDSVWACNRPVNSGETILFIDTNNSEKEIQVAKSAACRRGQRLVIVPENQEAYSSIIKKMEDANNYISTKKCSMSQSSQCVGARENLRSAQNDLLNLTKSSPPFEVQVQNALGQIKNNNSKIVNITISGHDGGGKFSGFKGSFDRSQLGGLMSNFPEINHVDSVLLLGCYSATTAEVLQWRQIFPNIKMIAGYDGIAPLSSRPLGHEYIEDILVNEKRLTHQTSEKNLSRLLTSNLQSLEDINASLYLQCASDLPVDYLYKTSDGRGLQQLNINECIARQEEMDEVASLADKYEEGELEPPLDSRNGELRQLYNKARNLEHCFEVLSEPIDINYIFNLLFYEGVKQNFVNFYANDLDFASRFVNFDSEELINNFNQYVENTENKLRQIQKDTELLLVSREAYLQEKETEINALKQELDFFFTDPKYSKFKSSINVDTGEINYQSPLTPEEEKNLDDAFIRVMANINARDKIKTATINEKNLQAEDLKQNFLNNRLNFENIKKDLQDPTKKIWIPNRENLARYSRKELMENIHRMHDLMSLPILSQNQRKVLEWIENETSDRLIYMINPFSWHEGPTGDSQTIEAPSFYQHLSTDMTK